MSQDVWDPYVLTSVQLGVNCTYFTPLEDWPNLCSLSSSVGIYTVGVELPLGSPELNYCVDSCYLKTL